MKYPASIREPEYDPNAPRVYPHTHRFTPEMLEALHDAYLKDTGEDISPAETLRIANGLWDLYKILMRPIPRKEIRAFCKRHRIPYPKEEEE